MGMKQILVMMAAVVLVGCSNETPETSQTAEAEPQVVSKPTPAPTPVSPADEKLITDPIVEQAIRGLLDINGNNPKGELTEADLGKVTHLFFGAVNLTEEGLRELVRLDKLELLHFERSQITDKGLKEVAKLQNLESLHFNGTPITDAGLKELAKLQNLKGLSLEDTKITDAGLKEVAKLQKLKSLS